MNVPLRGYKWLMQAVVAFLDCFPPKRVDLEEIALRKGFCETFEGEEKSCIWVHGASLGEVITLRPLLKRLADRYGADRILATATTMDGLKRLRTDDLAGRVTLLPIETPGYLVPFLERMKPELVIISETEIWPLFLATLRQRRIPYGFVNARINPKTVRLIKLLYPLFREAIEGASFFFPQDELYLSRFAGLGIPRERLKALGCFKFDMVEPDLKPESYRELIGLPGDRRVLCFGSTHPGEERIILEALKDLWPSLNATIIIAPRHLNRVTEVENVLREFHVGFSKLTQRGSPNKQVILVDTHGDLRSMYSIASLSFVGGSLIPRGGHNLMEPAAFGTPILSGPHTGNFPVETSALKKARALIEIQDAPSLKKVLETFLADPAAYLEHGARAKYLLQTMSGAVARTVEALDTMGFLPKWEQKSSCA